MKKIVLIISIFGLFLLSACTTNANLSLDKAAYVTIDINPSVGFTVDDQNRVIAIQALNADGEILLSNLNVENLELEEAMQILLDEAIELGFINVEAENTTVEIDVVSEDETIEGKIKEGVITEIKERLENRHIPHQVKEKTYQQAFVEEAKKMNMSPAHYRLMQQAMLLDPELTVEEAIELHVNNLVKLLHKHHGMGQGVSAALKEEFFAARDSIRETYLPQLQELEEAIEISLANGEPTEELESQLRNLKDTMKQEIKTVFENFKTQSQTYRETIKKQHKERMEAHHERVKEFKNKHGIGIGKGRINSK